MLNPLSSFQRRVLAVSGQNPEQAAAEFRVCRAERLPISWNPLRLRALCDSVTRRYPILSLGAGSHAQRAQCWQPDVPHPGSPEELAAALRKFVSGQGATSIAFAACPAGGDTLLCVDASALVADAATLNRLVREIRDAFASGLNALPDNECIQYAQLSEWLDQHKGDDAARSHWIRQCIRDDEQLPFGRVLLTSAVFRPSRCDVSIDGNGTAFILTAWIAFLWRCTGSEDLCVGYRVDARDADSLDDCLGLLTHYVPLQADVSRVKTFAELQAQITDRLAVLRHWQEDFSWSLYGEEGAGKSLRFGFAELPASPDAAMWQSEVVDRHALSLHVQAGGSAWLQYDAAQFSSSEVESLAAQFAALLRSAGEDAGQLIDAIPLQSPAQRARRIAAARAGAPLVERWRSVVELFEGAVDVHGKQTAIEDECGTLSYSQLDHEANWLARYLQSVGVEQGDAVPIVLGRTREQIISVLAVLKCGACYVPIDPQHTPAARLALMLQDCAARVVLSSSEHMSVLVQAQWEGDLIVLDRDAPEIARGSSARLSAHEHDKACSVPGAAQAAELGESRAASRCSLASAPYPVRVDPQSVAYVIYTSGSTGAPKGVEVTHRSVHNYVAGIEQRLGLAADAHLAALSTVGADLGYTALYGALCTGRTLRVIPERLNLDAHGLSRFLSARPLSALKIVPSHLRALLQACGPEAASWLPQVVILGGERLERSLIEQIRALKPNCRIFNHYGPTETTIGVLCGEVQPAAALSPVSLGAVGALSAASMESPSAADVAVALGTPLRGIEVHVLDRFLEPVLPGAIGELYIGGAALAQGYLRNARASAERFIAHPHARQAGERLYRTGDRVRLSVTGALQFIGRSDDQVKIRGHRVELAEIAAVLRSAPGVHDAAVLVHEARLQAFVATGTPSAGASAEALSIEDRAQEPRVRASVSTGAPSASASAEALSIEDRAQESRVCTSVSTGAPSASASAEALSTDDRAQESRVRTFVSTDAPRASASADVLSIDDRAQESHARASVPAGVPSAGASREGLSEHPAHEARVNTSAAANAPSAGATAEALTIEQLAHYLAERLPEPMRPERIVMLQALPLTGNGKLDRKALALLAAEQEQAQSRSVHAPRDATEAALAQIWRALLKREQIGIHENFFALGGDSIIAIQLVARARHAGIVLTPQQAFEFPTIAQQAKVSSQHESIDAEQGQVVGDVPLTPTQARFLHRNLQRPQEYIRSRVLEVHGELDTELLAQAVDYILRQHDSLRLRFKQTNGLWQQWCAHSETLSLHSHVQRFTLSDTSEDALRIALQAAVDSAAREFDLSAGPLCRFVYFNRGGELSGRLLILAHNLVIDGVSWRILQQDFTGCYRRLVERGDRPTELKTTSYREWSERLRAARGDDAQHIPSLSTDQGQEGAARRCMTVLDRELTQALLIEAHRAYGTSADDLLLAALAKSLVNWRGTVQPYVDIESHGRTHNLARVNVSRTTGWFATVAPVMLPAADSWDATVKAVKETAREPRLFDPPAAANTDSIPQIFFSYLGHFDQSFSEDHRFRVSDDWLIPHRCASDPREYLLEWSLAVSRERLHLELRYSGDRLSESEGEALLASYAQAIRSVVQHCASGEHFGYTPSDFPLLSLNQDGVDRMVARLPSRLTAARALSWAASLPRRLHGMLSYSLSHPDSGVYNVQNVFELNGSLDEGALRTAWSEALSRHDALRVAFIGAAEDQPLILTSSAVELPWRSVDWRGQPLERQEEQFERLLKSSLHEDFAFDEPPLMRLHWVRLSEQRARLVWEHHHAVCDGWSAAIVWREVLERYQHLTGGRAAAVASPVSYRLYLEWLSKVETEHARRFWHEYLNGFEGYAGVPLGRSARNSSRELAEREWIASGDLSRRLGEVARERQVTVNLLCQAAWALVLNDLSGESEVLFGMTTAGRPAAIDGVEQMVGLCINSVPVRVRLDGRLTVAQILPGLRDHVANAESYSYLALSEIQQLAGLERSGGAFDTLLLFESVPEAIHVHGCAGAVNLTRLNSYSYNHFPFTLMLVPGERLYLKAKYRLDCIEEASVRSVINRFARTLEELVARIDEPVASFCVRDPAGRAERLRIGYGAAPLVERWRSVVELFEGAVDVHGKQTAVEDEQGTLSYSQLDHEANRLARYLRSVGVEQGDAVPIVLGRTREQIISVLAVLKCGACYVPVDPQHTPAARLALMLQDCAARVVLSTSEHMSLLVQAQWEGDLIVLDRDAPEIARGSSARPGRVVPAQSVAYVIYTSGSTGTPKGVEVTHRSVHNYVAGIEQRLGLAADAHLAALSTVGADLGYTALYGALCTGRTLRLIPERLNLDAHGLSRLLSAQPLSALKIVPSHLRALLQACGGEAADWLPAVLILGGERLERSLIEQIRAMKPDCRIFNHYGPTETTIGVLCGEMPPATALSPVSLSAASMESPSAADVAVALGTPLPGIEVHVLDRFLEPVLPGAIGELYIGGAALAQGYLRNARASAERFIAHPHARQAGERLYRTGDRVRLSLTGALQFVGRSDDQVKIRGHRVELAEIAAVLRSAPGVHDAAVLVHDSRLQAFVATGAPSAGASAEALSTDDRAKESRVRVFVPAGAPRASASADVLSIDDRAQVSRVRASVPAGVPSAGASREGLSEHPAHEARVNTSVAASASSAGAAAEALTIEQLAQYLAERLPEAMRPERIVVLQALPLTGNGKLDRKALAQLAAEQEKTQSRSVHAPRDATEAALAQIWRGLLKREQIGIHENFFALGGDSIIAIQLVARARHAGIVLTPQQAFEFPTIAQQAQVAERTPNASLRQGEVSGELPLTPIQRRFFESITEAPHCYLQSRLFTVPGDIDATALRAALLAIWKHHDALRLVYPLSGSKRSARYLAPAALKDSEILDRVVLAERGEDNWHAEMQARIAKENSSFDLNKALLRALWFDRGRDQPGRLYILIHHLNIDGLSWRVLIEDLESSYTALTRKCPPTLPSKTSSYQDWANALIARTPALLTEKEREYWLGAVAQTGAELPICLEDYRESQTREQHLRMPSGVARPLIGDANKAYNTNAHELLAAALAWSLADWTKASGVWVELESHGRDERLNDLDLSRTIGWFTAMYPVRLSARGSDAGAVVKQIKEQLRAVPNKGIGYGLMRYVEQTATLSQVKPAVKFNFFGHVQPVEGLLLNDAPEQPPVPRAPGQRKQHIIELNAAVIGEELVLAWRYPGSHEAQASALIASYEKRLEQILAHCLSTESGGLTASDVPEAALDEEKLQELWAELNALL
jgi:amino acid adenylation domain-containing protein/non-ribosomal peptide synthase protein (TIGR01720 family)